jgi:hypothetical protein
VFFSLSPAAGAVTLTAAQPDWLQQRSQLVLAADTEYPPSTFVGRDGQPARVGIGVARAVGRVLGVPVEFGMGPWPVAMRLVLSGQADTLAGMLHDDERRARWQFAEPDSEVE